LVGIVGLILNWGDDVIPPLDDVTFLVRKQFFSFAKVFITISKYSVRFYV